MGGTCEADQIWEVRKAAPGGDRPLEDANQGPRESGHPTGISGLKT